MLNLLRRKYDLIILDTPPLMARKDALPLASLADDVILLVNHQRTPRDAVVKVIDMLRRQGAPGPGVVFSKADLRKYGGANSSYNYSAKYSRARRNNHVNR
jgi:Mrp family chromosome partitioning ATPase